MYWKNKNAKLVHKESFIIYHIIIWDSGNMRCFFSLCPYFCFFLTNIFVSKNLPNHPTCHCWYYLFLISVLVLFCGFQWISQFICRASSTKVPNIKSNKNHISTQWNTIKETITVKQLKQFSNKAISSKG